METQYLSLGEGTIAYDDQGQGALVLCVPAGGDLRSEYRFLTPQLLAAGYRVVTMDLRGQGESSADWSDYSPSAVGSDMLALIKHLNAGTALIIGTSVATAAAIWAAVEAPTLVSGLVLISAYSHAASRFAAFAMANLFLSPLWGRALYTAYFPRMYPSARPDDFAAHLDKVKAMLDEPGRMRALRMLFASAYRDWDERVAQVSVPVLIMMGSRDPDFRQPEDEARLLAERLLAATAVVTIFEGAGHHLQAEMPEQTAKIILDFVARRKAQPSPSPELM